MVTGLRLEEVRGMEALARKDFVLALFTLATATNNPTAIDPDDAAAVGTAPRFAKEDHQHAITAGAPAALTKTATSAESSGTGFARDAHVHATSALPWGIVARHILTADSSGFTAPGTADWLLDEVATDSTRLYTINLLSAWGITGGTTGDRALISAHADGTEVARLADTDTVGAGSFNVLAARALWEPATGTPDVDIRITGLSGDRTFTFFAGAAFPRQLWVEDIGPR